jgi:plasmid stabilization system protein ParE
VFTVTSLRAGLLWFAESALRDLEEVQAWYAERRVPGVGSRLVEEVFRRIPALADHPDLGRLMPEFDQLT